MLPKSCLSVHQCQKEIWRQIWRHRKSSFIALPGKVGTVGWHLRNCAPFPWWIERGDIVRQGYRLPRWLSGKESTCQCRRHRWHGFDPWVGKILEEEMASHSSILAGKSHGQRSLASYSPWGYKESGMTEATQHTCTWWVLTVFPDTVLCFTCIIFLDLHKNSLWDRLYDSHYTVKKQRHQSLCNLSYISQLVSEGGKIWIPIWQFSAYSIESSCLRKSTTAQEIHPKPPRLRG